MIDTIYPDRDHGGGLLYIQRIRKCMVSISKKRMDNLWKYMRCFGRSSNYEIAYQTHAGSSFQPVDDSGLFQEAKGDIK